VGWRVEIACAHFFSLVANIKRLETLFSALLSFVDFHIARFGGSEYFSEL
jgi:hypothetical protein